MAIVDLFYDVFKGIGEIGSEFIRVPNVSQDKGESSKAEQRIEYRTQPTISLNKDDKIVGARAAKGLARLTKATLRSPMTFTVAMAQGSHNAPKMWGDKTVRPQEKITGLGSGLKAAGKVCLRSFKPKHFKNAVLCKLLSFLLSRSYLFISVTFCCDNGEKPSPVANTFL